MFDKVRNLAWNVFYVWRHNRHFENRRTSNLKREVLQAKLSLLLKTPCLYHFWFWISSRYKQIKMAVVAILDDLVKNEKMSVATSIHVLVPLEKFGHDPTNTLWVNCVTDGRQLATSFFFDNIFPFNKNKW